MRIYVLVLALSTGVCARKLVNQQPFSSTPSESAQTNDAASKDVSTDTSRTTVIAIGLPKLSEVSQPPKATKEELRSPDSNDVPDNYPSHDQEVQVTSEDPYGHYYYYYPAPEHKPKKSVVWYDLGYGNHIIVILMFVGVILILIGLTAIEQSRSLDQYSVYFDDFLDLTKSVYDALKKEY